MALTTRQRRAKSTRKFDHARSGSDQSSQRGLCLPLVHLLQPMTWEASAILILAMITAWFWNYMKLDTRHEGKQMFMDLVCRQPDASCVDGLRVVVTKTGTTTESRQIVHKGTLVLKIPRRLQIWDEDAIRNETIHELLGDIRNDVNSGAILALYIARWQRRLRDDSNFYEASVREHPVHVEYLLRQLPSFEQFENFHPIFWENDELEELLRRSSLTFGYVKDLQRTISDEFNMFSNFVERKDYYAARLSVLTRAFGININASDSFSMVPILDTFDHQASPNVGFKTDSDGNFLVNALSSFRGKIHDSYGKRSDQNLFARYGFVNGDGTDYTQAGINLWHPIQQQDIGSVISASTKQQYRLALLRYLQYDDGYAECVTQPAAGAEVYHRDAWQLKQLKYRYLLHRAHFSKHWVLTMSPRNRDSSGTSILKLDPKNIQFNATRIFSTCRVLSLTHHDYNGEAIKLLEEHMTDFDYVLPDHRDALEYRTLFCVSRMASTAIDRFASTIELEEELVSSHDAGSKEWMAAHLRLGEMQTLQALKHFSFSKLRSQFGDTTLGSSIAFSMRNQPCPREMLMPLLDIKIRTAIG